MIERSDIRLGLDGGKSAQAYLARPEAGGPGVMVLHAWWGLKPFFKQVCDRLAENGFTALAPDLYQGNIAQTIEEAQEMLHLEQDNIPLLENIVRAGLGHLASLTGGDLGVMGFSMGAYWSMAAAANDPEVKAVVLFYGTGDVDFTKIVAAVQGHFAEHDPYESAEGVRAVEDEMKAASLDVTFYSYAGASHWFVEEDRPEYDPGAAKVVWQRTIEFLRQNL